MKIGILLLASAMLLCTCSAAPARWTKFGYSHQQFETDWGECQKEESPAECMGAKGYVEDK